MECWSLGSERMNIKEELFKLQDIKYRDFQIKLIPGSSVDNYIGVRSPDLKKLAKKNSKSSYVFERRKNCR